MVEDTVDVYTGRPRDGSVFCTDQPGNLRQVAPPPCTSVSLFVTLMPSMIQAILPYTFPIHTHTCVHTTYVHTLMLTWRHMHIVQHRYMCAHIHMYEHACSSSVI